MAEGDVLYFIGLMAQYYGERKNYPVTRPGTLALMTDEQIDTPTGRQNAYIGELASWPGNSGSPVFLSFGGLRGAQLLLGTKVQSLGILSGRGTSHRISHAEMQRQVMRDDGNPGTKTGRRKLPGTVRPAASHGSKIAQVGRPKEGHPLLGSPFLCTEMLW